MGNKGWYADQNAIFSLFNKNQRDKWYDNDKFSPIYGK